MDNKIDQKIKNILSDLNNAHKNKEKFIATDVLSDTPITPKDPFEMGLAYAEEERLLIELELAYSEKYPREYTQEQINDSKEEIKRLTHRIRAFQNRQWPSKYKE